jgi:radical SAM superfamily enzyme YgiQ (UPF0313 family)
MVLVGPEAEDNLGIRYIAAVLREKGFRFVILPHSPERIPENVESVLGLSPRLLGISVIAQARMEENLDLIGHLRRRGYGGHITLGGHFPTFAHGDILRDHPEIDSVVLFEGEFTAPELLDSLDHPERWSEIRGLAYRRGGEVVTTPTRPLTADLDSLPYPVRDETFTYEGIGFTSILGSRGCSHNCSFCSIRSFYGLAGGPTLRLRRPEAVAEEMERLYRERDVRFFYFRDDSFIQRGPAGRERMHAFAGEIERRGLHILFTVACRPDGVERETFERLRRVGLRYVFIGVESGVQRGLDYFQKGYAVDVNLRALEVLEDLAIPAELGFIIFDPYGTLPEFAENVRFLRRALQSGLNTAVLSYLSPYLGTPVEKRLRSEGRLVGSPYEPSYCLSSPQMDLLLRLVHMMDLLDLLSGPLTRTLAGARVTLELFRTFYPHIPGIEDAAEELRDLNVECYTRFLDVLEETAHRVEWRKPLRELEAFAEEKAESLKKLADRICLKAEKCGEGLREYLALRRIIEEAW